MQVRCFLKHQKNNWLDTQNKEALEAAAYGDPFL